MKTTAVATLFFTLLASSFTSAAPARRQTTITLQLSNDYTGAYADINIPADGVSRSVATLYANTPIIENGTPVATSAMLTSFQQGTTCTLSQNPDLSVTLTAEDTWASLDKGAQFSLSSATVACS
jgi:hypothetical protein